MDRLDWPDWARSLPEQLRQRIVGLGIWQWIGLIVVILIASILSGVACRITNRLLRLRERATGEGFAKTTESSIVRSMALLTGLAVAYPSTAELALPTRLDSALRWVLESLIIAATTLLLFSLWEAACDRIAAHATGIERAERLLVPMLRKFVRAVIVITAILIALRTLFLVDVNTVIAGLGIGGIVVALAAKDSVENVFGSVTILFDMPFAIGDWVKMEKVDGIVEDINLRSTRIRTFEDTIITVPNANLIRASLENCSARRARRQILSVRVSYDNSAAKLNGFCDDLRAWIEAQPEHLPEKTIVQINDLAEHSLGVMVQCQFIAATLAEEMALRHRLALQILEVRDRHGLVFAAGPRIIG